ncbi:probable cytochrome P450 49a1 [Eurytemora carolleeae]|uniref:probable cytochrome P450 49a1 n=1 Tax=Eurytemora carolleeae TaxID=1294199 RepID=UPI000C7847CE|nr:probable cytochrome P450 49a1 [Eurytemora carolleeae]|eukprot:XP_023344152.1 probable cytochrome P450 49a1 [Eurytemora affinis]
MKGFKHLPGPTSYPFIGNLLGYKAPGVGRSPSQTPHIWKYFNQQFGPLVRLDIPGNKPMVLVFDPNLAEQVYRNEGVYPIRPGFDSLGYIRSKLKETGGNQGLITSSGDEWREFRNKVQYSVLHPKVRETYLTTVHEIGVEFADHIQQNMKDGEDATQEFYKWALESIVAISLETRLNCFHPSQQDSVNTQVLSLMKEIFHGCKNLDVGAKLWRYFPSKTFRKLERDIELFTRITNQMIHKAIQKEKENELQNTLLGNLFSRGCDEITMTVLATDLIFGGVEQVAHAVMFSLYLLGVNPDKQKILHNELTRTQNPNYLKAVVKETMRLYPPAVGNIRQLSVPLELGEYSLEPGTVYILAHQIMSRNPEYVREPEQFIPERWMRKSIQKEELPPFLTLPFGWGPRSCIGRRFSEMEIFSMISILISRFQIGWEGSPLRIKSEIVIFPEGELRFNFKKR